MSESYNPRLQALIFEVVDYQIRDGNPPETKVTYERLKASGYTDIEIKKKIGGLVLSHLYDMLRDLVPMDIEKYVRDLKSLK